MFSEILRKLMSEKDISNYRVAKDINVSNTTIANWLNGVSRPNNEKLQKLADYFDVSVDYLIGKTDTNQEIAKRISAISKEKGITAVAICSLVGKQRGWLKDLCSGKGKVSDEQLIKIADFLGTTPEYLKGETDIKEKAPTQLSELEQKMLEIFRSLSEEQQKALLFDLLNK